MLSLALSIPEMNFYPVYSPMFHRQLYRFFFFIYRYIFYPVKYAARYFNNNSEYKKDGIT